MARKPRIEFEGVFYHVITSGNRSSCRLDILTEDEKSKRSADRILGMANVVIFNKEPPPGIPKDAKKFCRDDMEGYINFVKRLIYSKYRLT